MNDKKLTVLCIMSAFLLAACGQSAPEAPAEPEAAPPAPAAEAPAPAEPAAPDLATLPAPKPWDLTDCRSPMPCTTACCCRPWR